MGGRDIIVIGASAGGVEALCQLVRGLSPGLPASVFVVCHFPTGAVSALPEILSRVGTLLARHARDGEPTYPAHIYVAPPDLHMTLDEGTVRLTRGPRENRFRPSIDPLFRSAARVYGPRVIAALLSGALNDGVAGLLAVRGAGGLSVVQDPADAVLPGLPLAALDLAGADHVAPAVALGPLLVRLISEPSQGGSTMSDSIERITQETEKDLQEQARSGRPGEVSVYTCPECGGCLWQSDEEKLVRFRCHVGHAYESETLLADRSEALEAALWTAVHMLREKSVLAGQMANWARDTGNPDSAAWFDEEARLCLRRSELVQKCLRDGDR
jgi:two-component system chemotaxis response regulator CheB